MKTSNETLKIVNETATIGGLVYSITFKQDMSDLPSLSKTHEGIYVLNGSKGACYGLYILKTGRFYVLTRGGRTITSGQKIKD
jgi:hypothetical protein